MDHSAPYMDRSVYQFVIDFDIGDYIYMHFSDRSLPSQTDRSSEMAEEHDRKSQLSLAEEHDRKGQVSQDTAHGYKTRELDKGRRPEVPQSLDSMSLQLIDLMKELVNDRKTSEEDAEVLKRHADINSAASELRESYHQGASRSGEVARNSTADMESIGRSGRDLAGYARDSVQRSYDPRPSSGEFRSYQSQAGDQDERQSVYSQNMTEYPQSGVSSETGRSWKVYDQAASTPQQQRSYRRQAGDADDFNPDVSSSTEVEWLESWNSGSEDIDMRNYGGYRRGHY